jgi:hypothetical protein
VLDTPPASPARFIDSDSASDEDRFKRLKLH